MFRRRILFALLLGAVASPAAVCAQTAGDALPSAAQRQGYRLATVTAGGPAKLYVDWKPGCPAIAESCFDGSTLKPGDVVVMRSRNGDLAQVTAREVSYRYVALDRLQLVATSDSPAAGAWLGVWRSYKDTLKITGGAEGGLQVSGEAFWFGNRGVVHTGGVDASARPSGDTLELVEGGSDGCRVDLTLLGELLYAEDNGLCGGMNVRVSGFFRRAPAAAKAGAGRR